MYEEIRIYICWNYLPSVGSAEGTLVGVNLDIFDVIAWKIKKFSISIVVRNKIIDVILRITTFYGSSYDEDEHNFISKL
jgi:hypothetical protein